MRAAILAATVRADGRGTAGCTVLKVGGGLLAMDGALDAACQAIARIQQAGHSLVIVTGGGPFADLVRDADQRFDLGPDAAHWMAIQAMEQYAHWLVTRFPRACLAHSPYEAGAALDSGYLPIFAPAGWLRRADTLPHSWDLTSDSIAAFIAGAVDAAELLLLKPVRGPVTSLVDRAFRGVVPAGLPVRTLDVTELAALAEALAAG
jgi:aspartokinase-like uncharacterized kinase